ncbi:MAG TPA: DUF3301 domain-containing protein [Gallionella sp.]|jgi:hypothetical protein|nr:MAG: hypothetical protein A2Z87_04505 [Gallionellales bacterium GWA2_54_124]OGT19578.1 MAG: hypothetical protein A2522_07965 [Gallionellales bacterium RIFOXYD12_FULL_53_10]OGT38677.1 MAG: hypothetical protein A3K00_04730 [Gallionellales bacterium RIFOXYD2_FULL_52_7]HCI52261.1 DUF3301 domain-containing protein [Gallionella sp.]
MEIIAALLILALVAGYWFDSMGALDAARNYGRQVCQNAGLQFLDDTVENIKTGLARDKQGRRVIRRTYRFEFSETGNSRLEGQLILSGTTLESVSLDPYRIEP